MPSLVRRIGRYWCILGVSLVLFTSPVGVWGAAKDVIEFARQRWVPPACALPPMLGHTTPTSARFWIAADRPARLAVRVGPTHDLRSGRTFRGPRVDAACGFMGVVSIEGLQPATRYFYQVRLDGRAAAARPYPSFVTPGLPTPDGRVRFAFASCVGDYGYDAAAGYADLAARTNVDLVLMLGDNHYANTTNPDRQRAYYADQRRQAGWQALAAHTPIYAIWDDHDFGPNNSDGTLKGKERSLKVFREHWANPAYGEPDNPGVYYAFRRGPVEFFMLDDRYHRSPNAAPRTAQKTMLGRRQVEWLKERLAASTAPIKVLASGGEWQSHGTPDSWTSFPHERDEIFGFIEKQGIQGVLLISGDRHFTAAYHVRGKWIEVTSGPLGSKTIQAKQTPEMFYKADQGKMYCVYDIDTTGLEPAATLEVYRVAEGCIYRRTFSWEEINGGKRLTLPARGQGPKK